MNNTENNPFQYSTLEDDQRNSSNHELQQIKDDDKLFAMLIYLTSFFTSLVGPLIIWLIKRENSSFIDRVGKDYLNFFISYSIWGVIAGLLTFVLIGLIIIPIIGLLVLIFTIIGAVKSFNGETYLPPLSIRFIK